MIRESVTIEDAIDLLNKMLEIDPVATKALLGNKTTCNEQLIMDTDIQFDLRRVVEMDDDCVVTKREEATYHIGLLGVLNGLFGATEENRWGSIFAEFKLKCTEDSSHVLKDDQSWTSSCETCGGCLELGDIIRFCRSEQSFNG